ncbi:MAG TPA: hypothetical protein H9664_06255 [Firmicutes bacterium]|nr:hypothetical protein [Bacillota bacterium]
MKNATRTLICVLCLGFCLGVLAGCGENTSADVTPAPTGSGQIIQSPSATKTYLMDRDENLKNAIKEGEVYRYFEWQITDPEDPFAFAGDDGKEFYLNRRNAVQQKYGITIQYVAATANWTNDFAAAAYASAPITEVYNAGGPFTMYTNYNFQGNPGSVLETLSQYSEYADFTDSEWFDTESQKVTTYSGDLYFAVPNTVGFDSVSLNQVVFFNKEILAASGYEDDEIYQMYRDGTWTWDAFREIALACTDLDNEVYGTTISENNALMWNLIASNNAAILSQLEDPDTGMTYWGFTGNSDNALEAWDFFIQLGKDQSVYLSTTPTEAAFFRSGKVAMMTTYVNRAGQLTGYRQYPEFGIVPVPKGPQADNYVSSCNWFTPYCVFKHTANPAGSVQFLSEYCAPRAARSSEEAMASFDADAMRVVCDEESIEVLRMIPEISITEPYIIYWNTPTFSNGDSGMALCNLFWNYNEAFVDGSQTPSVLFESVADALNEGLKDAQIIFSTDE